MLSTGDKNEQGKVLVLRSSQSSEKENTNFKIYNKVA
jgi:hypothetical protein